MANIQFIGRVTELDQIKKISQTSFFLVVRGRRRIGKTLLLRKALPGAVYLFTWPDKSLDWILERIAQDQQLPQFKTFGSLLSYLFDQQKTVIIDEFQNFLHVDKSVYGEIQNIIDEKKHRQEKFQLAVAGSSHSLMSKVFSDAASPLYGRKTHEIGLRHLDIASLFHELHLPLQEFLELWSVFEGVPYYYELIDREKTARENIIQLLLSRDASLREEGKAILSIEFGKDAKTYNTVLTAIAEGKTKLHEIANLFSNKKNEAIKYLDILRREFNIVRKMTPLTEDPKKSRIGRYEILDNFLSFWFSFYDKYRSYAEQERFQDIQTFFRSNFNTFVGKKFEKFIISLIQEKKILSEFSFDRVGQEWGKSREELYGIDVVALNESRGEILFGECKWKENVQVSAVLHDLEKKSAAVAWNKEQRREIFLIVAKSFAQKRIGLNNRRVYCFDLKDIEEILQRAGS